MRPEGRGGSRPISDLLSELKITRLARRRLPLICDMAGPVWIPGGPRAERAVPNGDSARHVILRLRPLHVLEGS
jgi:tRNA(Ile)-lysidine synthase